MLKVMLYIILILVIIALEWLQIYLSKYKIGKWILPILAFILAINIMGFLISFELSDYLDTGEASLKLINFSTWMMFPVLNIPIIVFILTNVIMKKISKNKN